MFAGRLTKSKAEQVCKYYFIGGFIGLPFLWVIVVLTFYPYRAASERIKYYVSLAALLSVVSILLFGVWLAVVYGGLRGNDTIWIIKPDATTRQSGLFASDVYSVNF